MYSVIWLLLFAALLVIPALAVMPRLIFSAKTAIAIPLLSSLILYILKEVLYLASIYNTSSFRALILFLAVVAFLRLHKELKLNRFNWNQKEVLCYLFNFLLLLPLLLWFWTIPYDGAADSVTSWEFWAQQHYLSLRPDFFYTVHPYPQAFSVFISNIYIVYGSADYHQLARAFFFIFPYCILTILSLSLAEKSRSIYMPLWFSLGMYLLFFLEAFSYSCADIMMTAAVSVSAFYTLLWCREKKIEYIALSAVGALLAILSKQQAVFWTVLAWPALLLMTGNFNVAKRTIIFSIVCVFLIFTIWLFLEGELIRTFSNKLAIDQAFGDRNIFLQMIYGGNLVFGRFPATLIFLVVIAFLSRNHKEVKIISLLFVVPSLFAWIMFGTYSFARAGIHLSAVMAMMISFYSFEQVNFFPGFLKTQKSHIARQKNHHFPLKILAFCLGIMFVTSFELSHYFRKYPLDGGHRNTMVNIYEITSPDKFDAFYYTKGIKLFTINQMTNSVMLRRANIARPNHGDSELDMLTLIKSSKSDTLFPFPPAITQLGITFNNLARQCPDLFSPKITDYGLEIYAIDQNQLESCRQILLSAKISAQ